MEGTVPLNQGTVELYRDNKEIRVTTSKAGGVLQIRSSKMPKTKQGSFSKTGEDTYELNLETTGLEYKVRYYR